MIKRILPWVIALVLVVSLLCGVFSYVFKRQILLSPIKALTEERLSAFLGAKVQIGNLNFGLIRQVVLDDLRIDQFEGEEPGLMLASAKSISFQYNYANLLSRDFKNPHRVTLEEPQVLLDNISFPDDLFEESGEKGQMLVPAFLTQGFKLKLKNGRADYPLLENKYKIGFRDINGIFATGENRKMQVQLRAKGTGIFRGNAVISGEVTPATSDYDLKVQFKGNGELFLPGFMKLKKMGGTFRLTPNLVTFKNVRFSAADLLFNATGSIRNFNTDTPQVKMKIELVSDEFPHSFEFNLDFEKESIDGLLRSFEQAYPFKGDIFRTENSIRLAGLNTAGGYEVSGDFSIHENLYQLSIEKDPFRVNINFSFDDWDTDLAVNFEHFSIYGIDVVTFLKLRLIPTEDFKAGKTWKMDARLKTEYLILDTEPVSDIEGTFLIDHFSIKDLSLNWGPQYRLIGNYDLFYPDNNVIALEMEGVDLGQLKHLFFYTRPKEFQGWATGFIRLEGALTNPLVIGDIRVNKGVMSDLKFNTAHLVFNGYYPYLRVKDSIIIRKGGTLHLEGDLNLQAGNIFQDLKVMSDDHIVLWRGIVLSENLQDNLVMIGDGLKRKMTE